MIVTQPYDFQKTVYIYSRIVTLIGVTVSQYRVAHLLANLGWVDLDLGSSPGWWPLLQLPTAQAGWWNIPNLSQLNPVPVRQEMGHPVLIMQ